MKVPHGRAPLVRARVPLSHRPAPRTPRPALGASELAGPPGRATARTVCPDIGAWRRDCTGGIRRLSLAGHRFLFSKAVHQHSTASSSATTSPPNRGIHLGASGPPLPPGAHRSRELFRIPANPNPRRFYGPVKRRQPEIANSGARFAICKAAIQSALKCSRYRRMRLCFA
jgi:hypothetical protein